MYLEETGKNRSQMQKNNYSEGLQPLRTFCFARAFAINFANRKLPLGVCIIEGLFFSLY
jgi:hypothetical protein